MRRRNWLFPCRYSRRAASVWQAVERGGTAGGRGAGGATSLLRGEINPAAQAARRDFILWRFRRLILDCLPPTAAPAPGTHPAMAARSPAPARTMPAPARAISPAVTVSPAWAISPAVTVSPTRTISPAGTVSPAVTPIRVPPAPAIPPDL